jgi:phage-related baseplate assembly protein
MIETQSGHVLDRWARELGVATRKIVDASEPHVVDVLTGLPMETDAAFRRRILEARRGISPATANGKAQNIDPVDALQALRTSINVASQSDDINAIHKILGEMRVVINNALPRDRVAKRKAARVVDAAVPNPFDAKAYPLTVVPFATAREKR